jgi:hypothetical protein
MLTLPPAPERAALLDALESLVAAAGCSQLLVPPLAVERLATALANRGPRHLPGVAFEAAGMAEPEVIIMGGSGAATAFQAQGKAFVRLGADLAPGAAIASVIRATATAWRQARQLRPAASPQDDVAASVYLSLGSAEARVAHELGERERAAALVFLLAARALAIDDARRTAAMADGLGAPLDALYEDALRLLALRRGELRSRFRVDECEPGLGRSPAELIGSPATEDHSIPEHAREASSSADAERQLAELPCPCGGRWRIAERLGTADDPSALRMTVVCRVCLRWRRVLWRLQS